jgi:hypothetical protein
LIDYWFDTIITQVNYQSLQFFSSIAEIDLIVVKFLSYSAQAANGALIIKKHVAWLRLRQKCFSNFFFFF